MKAMAVPPERIELPAVDAVVRRHRLDDLDALQQAIEESRDHLRPWMIWADQTRDETATFLRRAREKWDAGEEFAYLIVDGADDRVLGGGGLHRRAGPEALEIGYWLRADATGRGVITAAAGALTDAAFALDGIERGGDPLRRGQRAQRGGAAPARVHPRRAPGQAAGRAGRAGPGDGVGPPPGDERLSGDGP